MRSHFAVTRSVALACAASGAAALSPGVAEAAQIAFDDATDAAYADGWQPGDNGGFGFSPWSMSGTYASPIQHSLDSTSPYNQLGTAWTLFNLDVPGDISQAGRGFAPLQVGDTITTIIDNPTERQFFRGYTVRLNTGGDNTTYGGAAQSRLAVGTFEYFTNGAWYTSLGFTTLFDTDTDAGLRLDITLTGADAFTLVMTPLDNPGLAFMTSGALVGSGPIDWIEFEFFNTVSDFHPVVADNPQATDFYIRSIEITRAARAVPEPATLTLLATGAAMLTSLRRGVLRRLRNALRMSAMALWRRPLVHT